MLAEGHEPSDELGRRDQGLRPRPAVAYAYPRRIEFVDDLPKTLTGKIRRIELREREAAATRRRRGRAAARSAQHLARRHEVRVLPVEELEAVVEAGGLAR